MKRMTPSALIVIASLITSTSVLAANWVIDGGYSFESGDYSGGEDIEVSILSMDVSYYTDVWGFSVELPYVSVTGSETFVPTSTGQGSGQGSGYGSSSTSSSGTVTRSGLGDIGLSVSRAFFPSKENGLFHELIASIKLPTASDNKNLGSGKTDYSLKLLTSFDSGNWTPLFSLGYQVNGDPSGTDLNDVWFYALGTRYAISRDTRLGVVYDFRQAVVDDLQDAESISVGIDWKQRGNVIFGVELASGLSDSSADSSLMLSLSKRY